MKKPLCLILAAVLLAACGADGPPERPAATPEPGVTVTGEANIGVAGTL